MKKIFTILLLGIILISCSKDDAENQEKAEPTIEYVSVNNASGGDVITIAGKGFDSSHTYIIKFNDTEGEILEVTSSFIRVQIPESSTSGDITFTYNGETILIGEFTIETPSEDSAYLYAMKDFPGYPNSTATQLVEIDPANGNETVLLDLGTNQFVESLVYDKNNSIIYGISSVEDENDNVTSTLYIIDVLSNSFNTMSLSDNFYYEITLSDKGKLFAVKDTPGSTNTTLTKFIEINTTSGNETELFDLETTDFIESLVYDKNDSTIYGVSSAEDENGNVTSSLISIDVVGNTMNTVSLSDNYYYEFALSDGGELFAIKDSPGYTNTNSTEVVEINTTSGDEAQLFELETTDFIESLVYDNRNGRIIGISSIEDENDNVSSELFIVDITTKTWNKVELMDDAYYELSYSN